MEKTSNLSIDANGLLLLSLCEGGLVVLFQGQVKAIKLTRLN
ncbi:hypothetical protein [Spirulina sp. 06S082]|nr:hypothetical protein [Spirulina sp. 06S082]MEA5472021.1 hypothetical protein [Spirulina sp. 06S082]